MQKVLKILLIIIAALFSSCLHETTDNQSNAALELYCRYAGNNNLTVAYLCDFMVGQHAINAVMIQANDDESWNWLQDEFDVTQHDNNYAIEMGMEWNTSLTVDENVFEKEYLDNEEIEFFAHAIVVQLNETMNSLLDTDGEVRRATLEIDEDVDLSDGIDFGMEFRDTTAMRRILDAVANKLSNGGLAYKDTIVEVDASVSQNASRNRQDGYVTAVDNSNHTLWIFYYDNADECSSIMAHIRKDIFTY